MKSKLQTKITVVNQLCSKLCKLGFVKSVAQWICNDIANIEHSKLFDDLPGFIPVKGKRVVNLKTGEAHERTKEHHFTYEIPIKYVPGKVVEGLIKFFFGNFA